MENMTVRDISVFGMGHVGLSMAVCLANRGFNVIGVDTNPNRVGTVNEGKPPFFEADLEELLKKALIGETLHCTLDYERAIMDSDLSFMAVGTPSLTDGSIDLRFVELAAEKIGQALKKKDDFHITVVKSSVVPGTTEGLVKPILESSSTKRCGSDFGLLANPEFLREGKAIYDILHPDRIVIGEFEKRSGEALLDLYRRFYTDGMPEVVITRPATAELIKYSNNAFLATKVSFINTLSNICERIPGVDVTTVAKGIGLDKRISPLFLRAGLGYGGICLTKDLRAIIALSKEKGYSPILLEAVEKVNRNQPLRVVELAKRFIKELSGKCVAILGLAFKPGTDDMREASSIKVINALLAEKAKVVVYDPMAILVARQIFGDKVEYKPSAINCLKNSDCCIIVTEWDEFRRLTPEDFAEHMKNPLVIDGRRIFKPEEFTRIKYVPVGLELSVQEDRLNSLHKLVA